MEPQVIQVPSIDSWPAIVALKGNYLVVALIKAVHLLGVAALAGSVIAFDLRILGFNRGIDAGDLGRYLLPLALCALVLIIPTGLVLFSLEASVLLESGAFQLKLSLLLLAAILALAFHKGPYRKVVGQVVGSGASGGVPVSARLAASASLVCWTLVFVCAAVIGRQG